jgi:hypothetical protein
MIVVPHTAAVGIELVITCLALRAIVEMNADRVIKSILALSNCSSKIFDIITPKK